MEVFKWIFKLSSPQWFSFQLHKGNYTRIHLIHPSVRKCWSVVISNAVGQWVISTPCWPGPGFIHVKQFRVYARNINDGDTLRDPPHKGSLVTIKDSCEATGPASHTGEGSRGPRIWLARQQQDCGKGALHGGALPVTLLLKVLVLPGCRSCFISSSGCWFQECFQFMSFSLIKNTYFPVCMIHCNQNSKVEKVRAV